MAGESIGDLRGKSDEENGIFKGLDTLFQKETVFFNICTMEMIGEYKYLLTSLWTSIEEQRSADENKKYAGPGWWKRSP